MALPPGASRPTRSAGRPPVFGYIGQSNDTKGVGLLVDAVSEVLTATADMIQPTPDVSSDAVKMFIKGILALEGRMVSWITLDRILPEQEAEAA